ncbi:MAG: AAA family ATPase, partial [Synechococcaceae cyanobacterium RM1_1_27]|nr:AAA family ATPase [Synechococcaceae cyanobacterium RM1_1_27]
MTAQTYGRLSTLGLALAQDGYGVILDAKYDQDALRREVIVAAQAAGIPIQILHCIAPEQVLRSRLDQRASTGQDIADATADLLETQQQNWDPFGDLASLVIPIQTVGDWKAQLMDLL